MWFLLAYQKIYRYIMAFGMAVKLSAALAELMLPYVLEHLVDDVAPRQDVGLVLLWGAVMLMLVVVVVVTCPPDFPSSQQAHLPTATNQPRPPTATYQTRPDQTRPDQTRPD